ncbi:MAG: carboxypeptidase regulatory-like domain-containing protein [Acidobacteria bacterium]|nr:carboxypeptidase regulatory-like domain-containing protein [Acidobacteriota bacterium]
MTFRLLAALALLLVCLPADAKMKQSKITIVVRNEKNEPVDRAAVIVKPMKGKKVKRSYELRTSQQGTAPLPPIDQGTILVQVIAKGYQTFGEKYEVTEPERTIEVKLKPPQEQFSVHK